MNAMITQLDRLTTYDSVQLSEGGKAIGCRWTCLIKQTAERLISKYKAQLVVQGFSQKLEQDFFETYALVCR